MMHYENMKGFFCNVKLNIESNLTYFVFMLAVHACHIVFYSHIVICPGILLHVSSAHVFTLNVYPCCCLLKERRTTKNKQNNKINPNL